MQLLRRVLWWQAALWAGPGLMLLIAPGWLVERVLGQPPLGDDAWLRVMGAMAIVLGLLMGLVANHVEEVWWWAWAFAILEALTFGILVIHALVGVPEGAPTWPWWLLAGANAAIGSLEVLGIAKAGTEKPPQ